MTMAVGAFAISFNAFAAKHLPLFEGIILVMFLIGFFVIIIPLWVLAPRASVGDVFGKFENWGGWLVVWEHFATERGMIADQRCTQVFDGRSMYSRTDGGLRCLHCTWFISLVSA